MTPAVANCTMHCVFCWRTQPDDIGVNWNETRRMAWDGPEQIVEGCIKAQQRILSGYKAQTHIDKKKHAESLVPKHVAISLAGEPTLYPMLGGLVSLFHKKGMTTFIVSNGTIPKALEGLEREPTQLYISVCSPDEKTFRETCRPQIPSAWQKLNQTLELLRSFKCPTVLRLTLVRNHNLKNPKGYGKLIEKANPIYVEPKAFFYVGYSRIRLTYEDMPTYDEIKKFAKQLSDETGYKVIDESADSRVLLLSRLEKAIRLA